MSEYFDIQCNLNDQERLDLKNNFDTQKFPSINIICGTNHLYNLTVNLQARKRKNSLIPPYIHCSSLNKCCKYSTTTTTVNIKNQHVLKSINQRLSFFDSANDENEVDLESTAVLTDENVLNDNNNSLDGLSLLPTASLESVSNLAINYSKNNSFKEFDSNTGDNLCSYLKQKNPISPLPGERRRLSLDTYESDTKQPQSKCLKCNNTSPHGNKLTGALNNSDDDSGICSSSSNHSSRSNNLLVNNCYSHQALDLPHKRFKLRNFKFDDNKNLLIPAINTNTKDNNLLTPVSASPQNLSNVSYSPSSPIIVLSNLSNTFNGEIFNFNSTNNSSKVLSELCTSTQNQLNLIDNNKELTNNINDKLSIKVDNPLLTSTPLTCNIPTVKTTPIVNNVNDNYLVDSQQNCADCDFYTNKTNKKKDAYFYLNNEDDKINSTDEQLPANQQEEKLEQRIIHFIRSPTDGVCLPIFKNQENNNNSDNKELNVNNSFNDTSLPNVS